MILYVTIEHSINPVLEQIPVMGFFDSLTQLLVPFMICYMLFFYIIFEVRHFARLGFSMLP